MNAEKKASEKQYFEEALSWETDKVLQLKKSTKLAWMLGAVGVVVGVIGVAGATLQATHEPPPPVVIRVDNSTGVVDVVSTIKDAKSNYEETVNKYFCQLYVRYREGYSSELSEEYYTYVGLMSGSIEQQKYFKETNPKTNPKSPINVYQTYAKVRTKIKSTSFIKPNVALVRYAKLIERGNDRPEVSHWAATITFAYSGAPMSEKDRAVNPLGFQVIDYRNDPDSTADKHGSEGEK